MVRFGAVGERGTPVHDTAVADDQQVSGGQGDRVGGLRAIEDLVQDVQGLGACGVERGLRRARRRPVPFGTGSNR